MDKRQRVGAGLLIVAGVALVALGYIIARPYVATLLYTQRIPTAPPLEGPPLEQTPTRTSTPAVLMPFESDVDVRDGETGAETPMLPPDDLSEPASDAPEASASDTGADTATPTPRPTPTATPVWRGTEPLEVSIPAIDLEAPVTPIGWAMVRVRGTSQPMWQVPDWRAAGWHDTSARLGVTGNTVLNGHNSGDGEVFRDLYRLETGAQIFVTGEDGEVYVYRVAEKYILREAGQPVEVRLENARYIQQTADERLTLVTCHPYGSLANRLIVIAYPVQDGDPVEKGVS
jgi:LPXTG-site transpeptidase (sortase) family protein